MDFWTIYDGKIEIFFILCVKIDFLVILRSKIEIFVILMVKIEIFFKNWVFRHLSYFFVKSVFEGLFGFIY